MTASEARTISEEKQISIEDVYKRIEETAKYGGRQNCFIGYLSEEVKNVLIRNGYKLSGFQDSIGMDMTKVEW